MATIASLDIALGANSATLKKDLDKASAQTQKWAKKQKKIIGGVSGAMRGLAVATAALGTSFAASGALQFADTLGKNAAAAGMTVEQFQRLQFGLEQSGISASAFTKSTTKLGTAMLAAERGSKNALDSFDRLGLSFEKLSRMNASERYLAVAGAIGKVEDASIRSALAQELLGKEFANNPIDANAIVQEGDKIATLFEDVSKKAASFNDALNRLSTNITNQFTNSIVPALQNFTPFIDSLSNFIKNNPVVVKGVVALTAAVVVLGTALTILAPAIFAIGAIGAPVFLTIAGAVTAVALAFAYWEEASAWVKKNLNVDLDEIARKLSYENMVKRITIIKDAFYTVLEVAKDLKDAVVAIFELDFASAGESIKSAWRNVTEFFSTTFESMFGLLIDNVQAQFNWVWSKVVYEFQRLFVAAMNVVLKPIENAINGIRDLYNDIASSKFGEKLGLSSLSGSLDLTMTDPGGNPGNRPSWMRDGGYVGSSPIAPNDPNQWLINMVTEAIDSSTEATQEQTKVITDAVGGGGGSPSDDGKEAADQFKNGFKQSLKDFLIGKGSLSDMFTGFLDTVANRIVDEFTGSLIDSFFGNIEFDKLFDEMFDTLGTTLEAGFSEIFSNIGGGSSGGFGDLISSGIGWLTGIIGLNDGGIVPHTPYSKIGRDSVPAMLTPGELVVPADEVRNFGKGEQTININITGDISRQTEKQIYQMLPQIAAGVNNVNKERG